MKSHKILFFSSLILGTLITISSYSWFSMWIGLEINLLSLIPLINSQQNIYSSESAIKYFIVQALASSILLFSVVLMFNMNEFTPQNSNIITMSINSTLLTKMGAAPFHFWFPEVMEGLNWNNCMIMLIWQKIAPMVMIMYNSKMIIFMAVIIVFSSIIGSLIGINQTSLRKILTYSSINHIAWMIASTLYSQTIWMIYFIIYALISLNIMLIFKKFNILQVSQLANSFNQNKMFKFMFMLNFLSLGGIPPFVGFFPKWLTINSLILNKFNLLSVTLVILTLLTLFFYLRVMFSTLTINSNEMIKSNYQKISMFNSILNSTSIYGIIICTLIFNLT